MSLGKKLFISGDTACTTDTADKFGDSSGIALYTLDYDASDESGNYDGTPSNVTFGVDGQINYGASFNGTDSYIELPSTIEDSIRTNAEFTVSCWIKPTASQNGHIVHLFNDTYLFISYNSNNTISARVYTSSSVVKEVVSSSTYSLNQWHHIVFTGNSTDGIELYVNNSSVGTDTWDGTFFTYTNATFKHNMLGNNRKSSGGNAYAGLIDQVRIFNKALSSNEVSTLNGETACVYTSTTDTVNYQGTNLAYYKLDNTAKDETGSYDGTSYNLRYTFGRFGQCADFNGLTSSSGTYISVPHNTSFSWKNNKTLSLWFKLDSYLSGSRGLAAKGNGGSGPYGWYLYKNGPDNKIGFTYYDSAVNAVTLVTNNAVDLNTWYHLCITTNGTTDKLYLNGVEEDSASSIVGIDVNTPLVIGRFYSNFTDYNIDGQIDQFRFYESTLDATAVANLYNEKQEAEPNFNVALYTGSGTADRYVSNVGFQPDLVWIKQRSTPNTSNFLFDVTRGQSNWISSDLNFQQYSASGVTSFEANGFDLGTNGSMNGASKTYVAWCWKGGGDAVSNTVGTASTQVSASDKGFSIVKWTSDGTTQTMGHGLNIDGTATTPELIITKATNVSRSWYVWVDGFTTGEFLSLNSSAAKSSVSNIWGSLPTSTVFSYDGSQINNTDQVVAYCFASVTGYQKIGSYEGNGTTKNVDLGFDPDWIMIKNADTASTAWNIVDTRRDTDTTLNLFLQANTSVAESNTTICSLISNGFSVTGTSTFNNSSGDTFIYMAFKIN